MSEPIRPVAPNPPLLECDIVMAGGATSGIVYPGAIAKIAERYAFRAIGGSSVGSAMAAATAAAEYGRRTRKNPSAFAQLARIPDTLGRREGESMSRLLHLFTAEPETRRLLPLVKPVFSGGGFLNTLRALVSATLPEWRIALPTLVALLAGVVLVGTVQVGLGQALLTAALAVLALALVLCVWVAATVVMLTRRWLPAVRRNGFGICTGNASPVRPAPPGEPSFESLTPWLHRIVQEAAGRTIDGCPLTFGDLWATDGRAPSPTAPRDIELVMTTSDISRNRSAELPFLDEPTRMYVALDVLAKYFPEPIVRHMREHARDNDPGVEVPQGVIRLPAPEHLPVVFGARLSLSFPVLLSAVPLLTPDYARRKAGVTPLRQVWFSDGGVTSNFPIHFFDAPLPARPTFCLNLVDFESEAPQDPGGDEEGPDPQARDNAGKAITEPRSLGRAPAPSVPPPAPAAARPAPSDPAPGDPVWKEVAMISGNRRPHPPFTAFDVEGAGLTSFVFTLVNTARYWSDNQLLLAPGVRDRVVSIGLFKDEGGLNLNMDQAVIDRMNRRGRAAGLLISARFDPAATQDPETGAPNVQAFPNHRWVRYRSFMAAFEDLSRRFARARRASDAAGEARGGESPLDAMIAGTAPEPIGYPLPPDARPYARTTTDDLEQLALAMAAATRADPAATFDRPRSDGGPKGGPAPRPTMRVRLRPMSGNDPRIRHADLPPDMPKPPAP